MLPRNAPAAVFALLAALTLLGGCAWPSSDPVKLRAIRVEARMLMKTYPVGADVPSNRLPRVIASLKPTLVMINEDGVHILTKPYFDGGWGYFVPRKARVLPEPVERFRDVGQGVYWWEPY